MNCGAACAKSTAACVFSILDQITSTAELVLNVADLVATGGEAGPVLKAAETTARNVGKRTLTDTARIVMKEQVKDAITKARSFIKPSNAREAAGNFLDVADNVDSVAQSLVGAYENGTFDWTALLPQSGPTIADAISLADPTGVFSGMIQVVKSFNKPICQ